MTKDGIALLEKTLKEEIQRDVKAIEKEFGSDRYNQMYFDLRKSGDSHSDALYTIRGEILMAQLYGKR